jgi:FkbM family methyltransferase
VNLQNADPRRTQAGRRIQERLRRALSPTAHRVADSMPTAGRLARQRRRVEQAQQRLTDSRAELTRLREALNQTARDQAGARGEFFRTAHAFTPFVVAQTGESRYIVPTGDKFSAQLFTKQQRREIRMLTRVQQVLEQLGADRGRNTLLEVGANVGTGAVEAIRTHGFQHVIAFEPHPENYKLLRMNAILNGVEDDIQMLQAAISDVEGEAVLQVSSKNSGAHSLSGGEVRAIGSVTVPTVSFDGMASRGELDPDAASLLWMDIEGYEVHALMGARSLIERSVPVVMELNPPVLHAAGRADQLLPTLAGHYTHVINMGLLNKHVDRESFQPVETIGKLLQDAEAKAMDVLVCRL